MKKTFFSFLMLLTTLSIHATIKKNQSPLKILHLSFHLGCLKDIEEVAQELGLNVTSWYILSSDLPRTHFDGITTGNAVYNISHERANSVWEKHKDYFNQFDVIFTSDTAPLSRIFLQNNWKKPLIIWICNRFDYFDMPSYDGSFPDLEYYYLFRDAYYKKNVTIVGYTPYEHVYAQRKGINTGTLTIKPLGSIDGGKTSTESFIPPSITKSETLFVYPRLETEQLTYIQKKCHDIDLPTYSGRYNGPEDLTGFKGILYFPYAWSNLALFENLQRGIIHFVPSEKFILEECEKVRYVTLSEFNLVEWYKEENRPYLVYFDSWDDLKNKIETIDFVALQKKVRQFGSLHRKTMLERWKKVFTDLTISTQNN